MQFNSGFNSFAAHVSRLEQRRQSSSARHLKKLMRNLYWLAYPIHQFNTNIYSNTLKSIWWDCSMCVQVYKELNLDAAKKFLSAYESWWWNYRQMLLEDPQVPMIRCCSAGWSWRLELELCERKTLLPGWWLDAGAGVVWEGNTVEAGGCPPAERGGWGFGRLATFADSRCYLLVGYIFFGLFYILHSYHPKRP